MKFIIRFLYSNVALVLLQFCEKKGKSWLFIQTGQILKLNSPIQSKRIQSLH
jgi:hypothetical protein